MNDKRRLLLGAFFRAVGITTIWTREEAGSQIEHESFLELARQAEKGLFDFFFLGENLALRELDGRVDEQMIAGRPDAITELAGLSAETTHIGLIATQNSTFNEPYELAARFTTLQRLSRGRAGWNIVTGHASRIGQNFRAGSWLSHDQRYEHAANATVAALDYWRAHNDVPRPVLFQAGDSEEGRAFAAQFADVFFSAHGRSIEASQRYSADMVARLESVGRRRSSVRILPLAQVILGETQAEADERAESIHRDLVTPEYSLRIAARAFGERWDQRGPEDLLPPVDHRQDQSLPERSLRAAAESTNGSVYEAVLKLTENSLIGGARFVGTPSSIADQMIGQWQTGAVDGFNLAPNIIPSGLDDITNSLVPELQNRGVYRDAYGAQGLLEQLGLPAI